MSSTRSTRRSRSGRHVRTTTSERRAVARQSMDRTSSPITYSRSESNSVPCPRTCTAARPSSSRSRAKRLGRCLREANSGSTRSRPGTSRDACRAASPAGPNERIVTRSASRSPRRDGSSAVRSRTDSPSGRSTACRLSTAPAEGCHASRTSPRSRRPEELVSVSSLVAGSLSRTAAGTRRRTTTCRGDAASRASTTHATTTSASQPSHVACTGTSATTGTPSATRRAARPVGTMSARDGDRGEHRVEHGLRVHALQLGLGA